MPDGGARRAEILNLPNVLTFGRLCAVPGAVWLVLHGRMGAAFGLFALAGITDALDGWAARRLGGSALGAALDPLADKALLISMVVTLAMAGILPDWLAILIVFRDLVIVGGVLVLWQLGLPIRIRPLLVSKLNTALQLVLVGLALLFAASGARVPFLLESLTVVVAATTLLSGGAYVWRAAR